MFLLLSMKTLNHFLKKATRKIRLLPGVTQQVSKLAVGKARLEVSQDKKPAKWLAEARLDLTREG